MCNINLTKGLIVAAISVSFGLADQTSAAPNLLVNGDFEQTNLSSGQKNGWPILTTGFGLPGWTLTAGVSQANAQWQLVTADFTLTKLSSV
jgi:hypothetical protein